MRRQTARKLATIGGNLASGVAHIEQAVTLRCPEARSRAVFYKWLDATFIVHSHPSEFIGSLSSEPTSERAPDEQAEKE